MDVSDARVVLSVNCNNTDDCNLCPIKKLRQGRSILWCMDVVREAGLVMMKEVDKNG